MLKKQCFGKTMKLYNKLKVLEKKLTCIIILTNKQEFPHLQGMNRIK